MKRGNLDPPNTIDLITYYRKCPKMPFLKSKPRGCQVEVRCFQDVNAKCVLVVDLGPYPGP